VKKIVLAALLAVAYEATFAAAPAAPPPMNMGNMPTETSHDSSKPAVSNDITYDITFSRDNAVLKQETLSTKVGVAVASSIIVPRDSTNCTFKDASGAPVNIQYSLNDETVMTAVPSALKDGRIETIIDARISRASPKDSVKSGECAVVTGQARSISVVDFVKMHQGDSRTYNLGDGTVMVLKLTKGGEQPGDE